MVDAKAALIDIDPDRIGPNPDNPRLVFREAEMNQLLESIQSVGIQVPLTVYARASGWVLIDGERRWRCAKRLNLSAVPAIVQPKPGRLENLLTMFNIHNVRTDWDLMPMALKLADVRDIVTAQGKRARPRDLAGLTGVSVPTVSRALELLDLPPRYQAMLLKEAEKPRDQQTITADLFIEINKSRRVVQSYVPEVFDRVSHGEYVDAMIDKYRSGVVKNVVHYRNVSKMARAERAGGDPAAVAPVIVRLVKETEFPIADAYHETVSTAYEVRDVDTRVDGLIERLTSITHGSQLSNDLRSKLRRLQREIERLLGAQ
jgi:ParB/RepB/Spo0J family partition protein